MSGMVFFSNFASDNISVDIHVDNRKQIMVMLKILKIHLPLSCLLLCLFAIKVQSQEIQLSDTLQNSVTNSAKELQPEKKVRKNIININLSNPMLISDRFRTIGYERVLRNGQSFTVNLGTFGLPRFISGK